MRKRLFCICWILLLLTGCADTNADVKMSETERNTEYWDEEELPDWMPVLTVSAFIKNDENDTWELTELYKNDTYEVHVGAGGENIELEFSCEGYVIEVTGEDKLMELSVGSKDFGPWDSADPHDSRNFGFTQQVMNSGFVSVAPIFCGSGSHYDCSEVVEAWGTMPEQNIALKNKLSYPGKELYLSVNVYELKNVNAPILFARLCLTQMVDEYSSDDHTSSVFELSFDTYELSDKYKMMIE